VKHKLLLLLAMLVLLATPAQAQITITYTFTNGTSADADQVNSNFSTLATNALNRTGGTITGNIGVNAGVTIDGVDIGAALGGTGTPTFASVTITGTGASALDIGGGLNAGTGDVAIIDATGKIAGISDVYFASLDGSKLTGLNATELTTGTLPSGRLSGTYSSALTLSSASNVLYGSGANLTALNGTQITSGTVADARLSANVPLINATTNTFTGAMRYGTSQVLSWNAKTTDTNYQASSDGFVVVFADAMSPGGLGLLEVLSDAVSTPTTRRALEVVANDARSVMVPIRKGDYYKVATTTDSGTISFTAYWVPMGTAG